MSHSIFSPSSTERWSKCLLSLPRRNHESENNEASIKGTYIHDIASSVIQKYLSSDESDIQNLIIKYVNVDDPKSNYTSLEEVEAHVFNYCFYIINFILTNSIIDSKFWFCEKKIIISDILSDHFGTLDFGYYDVKGKILHIVDLKTGVIKVEALNNMQLLSYAYGLFIQLLNDYPELNDDLMSLTSVKLHIVSYEHGIDCWEITDPYKQFSELEQVFKSVANKLLLGEYQPQEGDHCHYCPNANNCPIIKEKFNLAIKNLNIHLDKQEIDMDVLEQVVYMKPKIEKFLEMAKTKLENEVMVKGYYKPTLFTLQTKPSYIKWKEGSVDKLKKHPAKEGLFELKIKSFAEVKKILTDSEIEELSEKPLQTKLVPIKDKDVIVKSIE